MDFSVWRQSNDRSKMKAHASCGLNVARVANEDIRQEFGLRVSNQDLCDLATVRECNRKTLNEIATGLFEAVSKK
jgi:hypothetical protein